MTARSAHPSWSEILESAEAAVPAAEVTDHVGSCRGCRDRLERVRALLRRLESARLPRAPEAWNRAVLERIRAESARTGTASEDPLLSRVLARLRAPELRAVAAIRIADSLAPSAALRGGVGAAPRILIYDAGDYAISVSVSEAEDGVSILGQVSPTASDHLPPDVEALLTGGERDAAVEVNTFGEFAFSSRTGGPFRIHILLEDRVLETDPFQGRAPDLPPKA